MRRSTPLPALAAAALLPLGVGTAATARPDEPLSNELFKFEPGDVVETFDTDRFQLHYTRAGIHSVPSTDADSSGVPDHVESLGAIYEEVLDFYTATLGYRAPLGDADFDPSGDGRFDVYLVDFGFSADGAFRSEACLGDVCAGYMVQENDFAGYSYPSSTYANRLLASHELFHAVQAAYSAGQGSVFGEGTAVWASEQFDPSLDDLEIYAGAYLDETDRPLNVDGSGPVDSFTYGSGIFWQYFAETLGDDVIRGLWEACGAAPGADWFDLIDGVITAAGGDGFASLFGDFATATLMTGERADASRGFADGEDLPELVFERENLPFDEKSFLVFVSSYRTLAVIPGQRDQVRVALLGEGEDVDGVRVTVAPLTGNTIGDIVVAEGFDVTFEVPGADFALVQVVNARQSGNGARPSLCVGTSDEVEECLATFSPPPPEPLPPDDGEQPSGCGNTQSPGAGGALALFVALGGVALLGRSRPVRRGQKRSST